MKRPHQGCGKRQMFPVVSVQTSSISAVCLAEAGYDRHEAVEIFKFSFKNRRKRLNINKVYWVCLWTVTLT